MFQMKNDHMDYLDIFMVIPLFNHCKNGRMQDILSCH